MEVVEIAELYKHIKKHYPFFDASIERVKDDCRYLRDFPKEVAWHNIDQHILTETVTPNIAHIRGRLGDKLDSQRSKDETVAYFDQLEQWNSNSSPPPSGFMDTIRAKVKGGDRDERHG